jgi:hypothetical protein
VGGCIAQAAFRGVKANCLKLLIAAQAQYDISDGSEAIRVLYGF